MKVQKEHEYCLRCGRKLKNPEARRLGYGKVCLEKSIIIHGRTLFEIRHNLQSSQNKKKPP
jgi:hypothetical protein